ncbi:RNA polymerase-associated protein RTF1 [Cryptococcus wingfieldii CBS 7118]|uniref:RNA polymerase-associated protein RTF1 n=1 Tax=Cryptococcus wingfieldii CBS 7118 TaxID=1295528 RepID=A0A1E3IS74_9TREE|nr:RNA polymerase-associated protein RTF1 [Cryptococcus wingfieldii CBS 7118]ODN91429.1 RNA polymerase-associated protein RTF1 [Cryptococcus wingfieldii CBS 7118]
MSDLENELLGLAEDDPTYHKKGKRKSKAYIEDSDEGSEMDMEMESEDEGDAPQSRAKEPMKNPYPVEGKYVSEDDRDYLENLPEIERENILAGRLEEMQRFKDSQALDAMFKTAHGGDESDDEDMRARKRRKHTSVTDKASKALDLLKDKRKAKDERAQRRSAARKSSRRSPSPGGSSEEGEIQNNHRSVSYSPEPSLSPAPKASTLSKEDEMDTMPPNRLELEAARLSRYELVDMMHKDGFEDVISGAYVRLMSQDRDEVGRPKYRIHKIMEVDTNHQFGSYSIEYQGRQIKDNRALLCKYGSASRLFRMADVSNGAIEDTEFQRFSLTNEADGVKPPKRSTLKKKHEDIKSLRDRPMTNSEIDRRVASRRAQDSSFARASTLKIHQLMNTRDLAVRRNDHSMIDKLNADIIALGGDPVTGKLLAGEGEQLGQDDYDLKIQKINENNKRKTKESMMRAHQAAQARKKAEEAVVKAKLAAQKQAEASTADIVEIPQAPPASGQKKGETPQQYVARTVQLDLDLGDF